MGPADPRLGTRAWRRCMSFKKLLIANRGEIAIRIARAAADSGIATVAIHPADDAMSLHVRVADEAVEIPGRGARAYLDIEAVVKGATASGCDAVHPGYGFLSENAAFAKACADAGVTFVGPTVTALELFGDKVAARKLAKRCGVPIIAGTSGSSPLAGRALRDESTHGPLECWSSSGSGRFMVGLDEATTGSPPL